MKIKDDFIKDNKRIYILPFTDRMNPSPIPMQWGPVLTGCDMLIVIPDMHMYIRNSPLDNFKFGREAMLHFLDYLGEIKDDLEARGKTLCVLQLGDYYELRFPSLDNPGVNATAEEIRMSSPEYDNIVNKMYDLNVQYLFGNHDFESRHFAQEYRFGKLIGQIYIEHGFSPSPPDENPGHPLWDPFMFLLLTGRKVEELLNNLRDSEINVDSHYAVGVISGDVERLDPSDSASYPSLYKDYYLKRIRENPAEKARICIIGHTHLPHIHYDKDSSKNDCLFVDAGAWTEGRSNFVVVTQEEIAVCHYKRS